MTGTTRLGERDAAAAGRGCRDVVRFVVVVVVDLAVFCAVILGLACALMWLLAQGMYRVPTSLGVDDPVLVRRVHRVVVAFLSTR